MYDKNVYFRLKHEQSSPKEHKDLKIKQINAGKKKIVRNGLMHNGLKSRFIALKKRWNFCVYGRLRHPAAMLIPFSLSKILLNMNTR